MKDWNKLEADVNYILTRHFTPGRGGNKVNKVVIHYNAGNLSLKGIYDVWQKRRASAHYQVDANGSVGQYVWDKNTAWHAGNANRTSIGIEHANRPDGTVTQATLDNGAHLTAAVCKYYGLGSPRWGVNVFPHNKFMATSCPGQLDKSQKDAYIKKAQMWYNNMNGVHTPAPAKPTTQHPATFDVDTIARGVIAGRYGNGQARRNALGSNYDVVQARVNQILKGKNAPIPLPGPNIDQLARDVIKGKYGNGQARRNALGSNYQTVQNRVNQMLRG